MWGGGLYFGFYGSCSKPCFASNIVIVINPLLSSRGGSQSARLVAFMPDCCAFSLSKPKLLFELTRMNSDATVAFYSQVHVDLNTLSWLELKNVRSGRLTLTEKNEILQLSGEKVQ